MKNKNRLEALPQNFGACVPGMMMTFFGALLGSAAFLVVGPLLIVIPAVIVIVRRVAGK